jgi:hypothetical protein
MSLTAIMPAAPVLFSTTTGWPSEVCSFSATRRPECRSALRREPDQNADRSVGKTLGARIARQRHQADGGEYRTRPPHSADHVASLGSFASLLR